MSETFATLRANASEFRDMILESSLDGDKAHSDIYLNVLDDRIITLQITPGDVLMTYCTFDEDYFDSMSLHRNVEERTTNAKGYDVDYETGAEAILDVEQTLDYLDHAGDGFIDLTLSGEPDERLASQLQAAGALEVWVNLPGSQTVLDKIPHWLTSRFNGDDVYSSPQGDEAPTIISTEMSEVRRIISAQETVESEEFYPLVVDEGEFTVNVGDEMGSGVKGSLNANNVSGPDIDNRYLDGFNEIFSTLDGNVDLQTGPGNNPLAVIQIQDDHVIRHVNGPVDKP